MHRFCIELQNMICILLYYRKINRKSALKKKQALMKQKMEAEGRAGTRSAEAAIANVSVTPRPEKRRCDMTEEERKAHDKRKRQEREAKKHPQVNVFLFTYLLNSFYFLYQKNYLIMYGMVININSSSETAARQRAKEQIQQGVPGQQEKVCSRCSAWCGFSSFRRRHCSLWCGFGSFRRRHC